MKKYSLIAAGGTLDHLHRGHRDFLNFILDISENAVIGLTSDRYVEKYKNGKGVESFETRKNNLVSYLESINSLNRVEIVSIDDQFGPAITQKYPFEAIAVTEETRKGAEVINRKRKEIGLLPLAIKVFTLTRESHGNPTNSTTIRETILTLPPTLRVLLQDPWGEVLQDVSENLVASEIVTVGDVTTKKFLDKNLRPKLSIIDLKIEREHSVRNIQELGFSGNEEIVRVENPAASITPELVKAIQNAFEENRKAVIIVDGEEDLAVLPSILEAPLGFSIFYGQPGQGMVRVVVTEEIKKKAQDLLDKFDRKNSV